MVNIAICDDDQAFRTELSGMLKRRLTSAYTVTLFSDGMELLRALELRQGLIDLILLDIRMPKLDGLEAARRIREMDSGMVIILITSYGEYVFEGYDVKAFHFITKPLDESRLIPILERAIREAEETRTGFLAVNRLNECVYLPHREILYLESGARKLTVHSDRGELAFYGKLSELAARLRQKGFFQIHRCYLVNLDAVRHVDKRELWVHLRDGSKLEVSRRRLVPLLHELLGRV